MMDATSPAPAPAVIEWRFGGMLRSFRRVESWWAIRVVRDSTIGVSGVDDEFSEEEEEEEEEEGLPLSVDLDMVWG